MLWIFKYCFLHEYAEIANHWVMLGQSACLRGTGQTRNTQTAVCWVAQQGCRAARLPWPWGEEMAKPSPRRRRRGGRSVEKPWDMGTVGGVHSAARPSEWTGGENEQGKFLAKETEAESVRKTCFIPFLLLFLGQVDQSCSLSVAQTNTSSVYTAAH